MPGWRRLAGLLLLGMAVAAGPALAQGTAPPVPPPPPGSPGSGQGATDGGVLAPPPTDPSISKPPPRGDFPMKVIPPPGSAGGNRTVQPK
jgi:hypothetical protein